MCGVIQQHKLECTRGVVLVDGLDECMGRDEEVGAVYRRRGRFYQLLESFMLDDDDDERYAKGFKTDSCSGPGFGHPLGEGASIMGVYERRRCGISISRKLEDF